MEQRNSVKKSAKKQKEKISNPELEREIEEKHIKSSPKDFNDVGGFPRPPLSGGIL